MGSQNLHDDLDSGNARYRINIPYPINREGLKTFMGDPRESRHSILKPEYITFNDSNG